MHSRPLVIALLFAGLAAPLEAQGPAAAPKREVVTIAVGVPPVLAIPAYTPMVCSELGLREIVPGGPRADARLYAIGGGEPPARALTIWHGADGRAIAMLDYDTRSIDTRTDRLRLITVRWDTPQVEGTSEEVDVNSLDPNAPAGTPVVRPLSSDELARAKQLVDWFAPVGCPAAPAGGSPLRSTRGR